MRFLIAIALLGGCELPKQKVKMPEVNTEICPAYRAGWVSDGHVCWCWGREVVCTVDQ